MKNITIDQINSLEKYQTLIVTMENKKRIFVKIGKLNNKNNCYLEIDKKNRLLDINGNITKNDYAGYTNIDLLYMIKDSEYDIGINKVKVDLK